MVRGDMGAVVLCETMGWTYQQYLDQPLWFIKLLTHKLQVDATNRETKR